MRCYFLYKFLKEEKIMNYNEKQEEIMEKHIRAVRAIAYANNVDMGVALDMLEDNVLRGGRGKKRL